MEMDLRQSGLTPRLNAASVALGQGAQAAGGNVAIGNGSVANARYDQWDWVSDRQAAPKTAVSVGNASALRRITNVFDGHWIRMPLLWHSSKNQLRATVAQVKCECFFCNGKRGIL